jgi:sugar/nucleoside kinase (ribokinase family)
VLESLTSEDISSAATDIRGARFVVVDGNVSDSVFASVARVCRAYNIPVLFEPTSVAKAVVPIRAGCLGVVDVTTPNEVELIEVSGGRSRMTLSQVLY